MSNGSHALLVESARRRGERVICRGCGGNAEGCGGNAVLKKTRAGEGGIVWECGARLGGGRGGREVN